MTNLKFQKTAKQVVQPKYEYLEAFAKLESSENGLSQEEINYRLKKYGANILQEKIKKHLLLRILHEFKDLMVIILIISATIALFAKEFTDSIIIYIVVFINGLIGFIQKYKAEKEVEALKKSLSPQAKVIREGQQMIIDTKDLVPGDILILNEGDSVGADGIIFEYNEFETQEAPLSGESTPIAKSNFNLRPDADSPLQKTNVVFMGTSIAHGNAKVIVTRTGMNTEFGKIAKLTQETKKDQSPLEKEMDKLGRFTAKIALGFAALLIIYGFFIQQKSLIDNILFAASVAVAAVPEGLPATITIALALGVQKLSRKKAIVKQLSSVETLGATTVICSDKTGTLTKNEMTVTDLYIDNHHFTIEGNGYEPKGAFHIFEKGKETSVENFQRHYLLSSLEWLNYSALLCNNAALIVKDNQDNILGDPTEAALLVMGEKFGFKTETIKTEFKKIHEFPFDARRKKMTMIVQNLKNNKFFAFTKGAADELLKISDQRIFRGRTSILTRESREEFMTINEQYAQKALRPLGFAYRELPAKLFENPETFANLNKEEIEKNLIFIGLAGMIDSPRPEVKAAIALTKQAGIKTYIISGDHSLTVKAIAEEIGLISTENPPEIILGTDLEQISLEELKNKLKNKSLDIVFARVNPEHKLKIVEALKENGEIVAMTGDGVNDAPALKKADIGIAMGIGGTDVSKEAANLVLADDSYSTIVTAIKEGRTIYSNLKKFVFYMLSSNLGELLTILISIIIGLPSPFTPALILCVNLVTDLFPALALGVEASEEHIMNEPPKKPEQKIMNKKFLFRLFYVGASIGILVSSSFILKLLKSGWRFGHPIDPKLYSQSISVVFAAIVFIQLCNALNARSEKTSIFKMKFFSNKSLLLAILSSFIICLAILEIPFFQNYLKTSALDIWDWAIVVSCGLGIIILEEIRKFFKRKNEK